MPKSFRSAHMINLSKNSRNGHKGDRGGGLHELLLGQRERVGHKNVEHVPSVRDDATARAALHIRKIEPANVDKPSVQGPRDVGAPLVPLLHLAQLHAADGGLHVEHAVVAAMVGKIMHSVLQVKVATASWNQEAWRAPLSSSGGPWGAAAGPGPSTCL